jgi:hypothetical protein
MAEGDLDPGNTLLHYHHLSRHISHLLDRIKALEKVQGSFQAGLDTAKAQAQVNDDLRNEIKKHARSSVEQNNAQEALRQMLGEMQRTIDLTNSKSALLQSSLGSIQSTIAAQEKDKMRIPVKDPRVTESINRLDKLEEQQQGGNKLVKDLETKMQKLEKENVNLRDTNTNILKKLEAQEHVHHRAQDSLPNLLRRGASASQFINQPLSSLAEASINERSNRHQRQQKSSHHLSSKPPNAVFIPLNDTQDATQSSEVSLDDSPTPHHRRPEQSTQRTARFIQTHRRRSRSRSQAINRFDGRLESLSVIRPPLLKEQAPQISQNVFQDTEPDLLFGNEDVTQNVVIPENATPFSRRVEKPIQMMPYVTSAADTSAVKNKQDVTSSDAQGSKKITLRSGRTVIKPCFSIPQPRTKAIKPELATQVMPKTWVPAKRGALTTAKASVSSKRAKNHDSPIQPAAFKFNIVGEPHEKIPKLEPPTNPGTQRITEGSRGPAKRPRPSTKTSKIAVKKSTATKKQGKKPQKGSEQEVWQISSDEGSLIEL